MSNQNKKIFKSLKFRCLTCDKFYSLSENEKGKETHNRKCESELLSKYSYGKEFLIVK